MTLVNGKWVSALPDVKLPQSSALFANAASVPAVGYVRHGASIRYVAGSNTGHKRDAVPYPMLTASGLVKECSMMVIAAPQLVSDASIAFASYGHSSASGLFFLTQGATGGQVTFWCRDDGGTSQNPGGTPPSGVWSNSGPAQVIIGTRSQGMNFHRTYVGGSKVVDTTATALGNATFNRTGMGCLYYNGGAAFQFHGNVALMVSWSRALTHAECLALSANPWAVFEAPTRVLNIDMPTGGGARTLTASAGVFSLAGQSAGLLRNRVVSAAGGTYSLAGQSANVLRNRVLSGAVGTYSLAGQAATLRRTYVLAAAAGGYTLSGQAANLLFGHRLIAAAGTFTLAGQSANLVRGRALSAAVGSFSFAGQAAGLLRNRNLQAAVGTYSLAGQAVTLTKTTGKTLVAAGAAFALQGQSVNLEFGRRLVAAQGAFALAGQAATLRKGRTLAAGGGTYSLAGQPASFARTYRLTAVGGTWALSGKPVTFRLSVPAASVDVAYEVLRAWFEANWSATARRYENELLDPPADLAPFVFFEVFSEFLDHSDIGSGDPATNAWREEGEVVFHVMVATGTGSRVARQLAEQLAMSLRGLTLSSGVRIADLSIGAGEELTGDGNYFDLPLAARWVRENWTLGSN